MPAEDRPPEAPATLGSRLRRLAARLAADAEARGYRLAEVDVDPRWVPVLLDLDRVGPRPLDPLAEALDRDPEALRDVLRALRRQRLVTSRRCHQPGGGPMFLLASRGEQVVALLEERVQVTPFRRDDASDAEAFERLNLAWIERYFQVEDADRVALGDPLGKVLAPGGEIFMARLHGEVVGTAAMIPLEDGGFELAKMAVASHAQGLGIGEDLARAGIAWAQAQGAPRVFLESNRSLTPALRLYAKLGFVEVEGPPSPYARADIQMELTLPARRSGPATAPRKSRPS